MITNDYRNTEYCPELINITSKKEKLEEKIKKEHPKQKIIYNRVHVRDTVFNEEFCDIYNCKCAYCGVSMKVLSSKLFEVDHFIAESLFDSKIEAGKMSNLVLACYQCNRNKGEFPIEGDYIKKLNTDNGERVILTFAGDNSFVLVEETMSIPQDFEIVPVYGDPEIINDSVGALSANSLSWTSNNVNYYLTGTNIAKDDLISIATSMNNVGVVNAEK